MSGQEYRQVYVDGWAAASAAGDAASTWAAIKSGTSALRHDAELGWCGLLAAQPCTNLVALASAVAAPLASRLGEWPVVAISASKGDTPAFLGGEPDPARLSAFLPGHFSMAVTRSLGVRHHQGITPVAACSTGLYGLLAAADAIEHGLAGSALAGAADASMQPLLRAGFASLGVMAQRQPQAFTGAATGFAIGEGAGFLRLNRSGGSWQVRAGIRLGDASHPTACDDPAVLHRCLDHLWSICPEPDLIVAHATGTRLGDSYELGGLNAGPWRDAKRVCCKPVIGHCLGASGAVELACALEDAGPRLWKLGLGFGGHIAAVALERC